MPNILIIGATRGLGASLANLYAAKENTTVYGTTRAAEAPKKGHHEGVKWVRNVDLQERDAGRTLVRELEGLGIEGGVDVVVSALLSSPVQSGDVLGGSKGERERVLMPADHHSRLLRNGGLQGRTEMGGGSEDVVCLPLLFRSDSH